MISLRKMCQLILTISNQMKDDELPFDHKSHVLYSKPCKKEILAKIALHYPEAEREAVWEQVQLRYAELLSVAHRPRRQEESERARAVS